jgi:outer membrane protein assembly factor BamB
MYIGVGNKLLAIDIEDQQMLWAFQTEGSVRSSPAVVGKTVYIGSEEGRLYAVDATSGQRLWEVGTDDRITSSPAVADGMIYIGSHDGNLYAIK